MSGVMVDSNVLLDILTGDGSWYAWSSGKLEELSESQVLVINPIIYAEVSVGFHDVEDLEYALLCTFMERRQLPWAAAFLAGKCFLEYRRRGGTRRSPLPDFYIGAHAAVEGMKLLTRDAARYRTYFPRLRLIAPA